MYNLVYYSSQTGNTESFIQRLGFPSLKLPIALRDHITVIKPFIMVIPTYAANDGRGALPKSVVKFLNDESNRKLIRGVIASGNTNFGYNYCLGGNIVAEKCNVPVLYRFELRGTNEDVSNVKTGLERFWKYNN